MQTAEMFHLQAKHLTVSLFLENWTGSINKGSKLNYKKNKIKISEAIKELCVPSRTGVLKLFKQGGGVQMKWQAVICSCLVPFPAPSPPNPWQGQGGSVDTGGRIEDPGGLYLACGP